MSKSPSRPSTKKSDRTAAVTLEVPSGVADDIEAILRNYAEEAELDTSLVVDHSGFLIAGISSIPDVDVDTVGALVAGAGGATEGLTGALGEEGRVESLHLGEDRLLYLKEVGDRYILVGVSDSNVPAGILRDQANLIEPTLLKHLSRVKAVPMSLTKKKDQPKPLEPEKKPEPPKSLRQNEPSPTLKTESDQLKNPVSTKTRPAAATASNPAVSSGGKVSARIGAQHEQGKKPAQSANPAPPKKAAIPVEAKRVEPHAIVENSPFEMDDDDDEDDTNFKPVRPNTTPVHLSVPEARKREAAAKKENQDDDDQQSGPRYSFELG